MFNRYLSILFWGIFRYDICLFVCLFFFLIFVQNVVFRILYLIFAKIVEILQCEKFGPYPKPNPNYVGLEDLFDFRPENGKIALRFKESSDYREVPVQMYYVHSKTPIPSVTY